MEVVETEAIDETDMSGMGLVNRLAETNVLFHSLDEMGAESADLVVPVMEISFPTVIIF